MIRKLINKVKMNVIERYLANLVDKFKTKNATMFAAVAAALLGIQAGLNTEYALELLGETITQVLIYLDWALLILLGAHTPQENKNEGTEQR